MVLVKKKLNRRFWLNCHLRVYQIKISSKTHLYYIAKDKEKVWTEFRGIRTVWRMRHKVQEEVIVILPGERGNRIWGEVLGIFGKYIWVLMFTDLSFKIPWWFINNNICRFAVTPAPQGIRPPGLHHHRCTFQKAWQIYIIKDACFAKNNRILLSGEFTSQSIFKIQNFGPINFIRNWATYEKSV